MPSSRANTISCKGSDATREAKCDMRHFMMNVSLMMLGPMTIYAFFKGSNESQRSQPLRLLERR